MEASSIMRLKVPAYCLNRKREKKELEENAEKKIESKAARIVAMLELEGKVLGRLLKPRQAHIYVHGRWQDCRKAISKGDLELSHAEAVT
jgi:hypothetical protein